jgi:adenosylmethionine-8-amino-7-oxononanoate aminotransferase
MVKSAAGTRLKLADGSELIDGISSWWTAAHGHNHPSIIAGIEAQMRQLSHVMFAGFTHEPAVKLTEQLIKIAPAPLNTVFYSDSGSVSVEIALKMAIQYQNAKGKNGKQFFLTVRGGYHGDTFATMALSDPVNGMHSIFRDVLPEHFFAPVPAPDYGAEWDESSFAELRRIAEQHHHEIAAVIIEPIFQGAGGMRFYSPEYLRQLRMICNQFDLLLIFDEIATGFGRTGKMFAAEHAGIAPDIMCIGKALTGGCLTLAATMTTTNVAETIASGNPGILLHGPTYMANPLACAAAYASLTLFEEYPWQDNVKNIEAQMRRELLPALELPAVAAVRVLGAIGVIETKIPVDASQLQQSFTAAGVWLRPFGKYIYLMPPFIISSEELSRLTTAAVTAASITDRQTTGKYVV